MGRFPFPQNQRLASCSYPESAKPEHALRAFQRLREEIITADGAGGFLRTRRPDTPDGQANSTVSEGIAYGVIIAVMFDDQPLFDALYRYARYRSFVDAAYLRVATGELLARSRYYNHCWTVLSLLMLSGNLVNLPE